MKDYDKLYRSIEYPMFPNKNPPTRDKFQTNAQWGIALDLFEDQFQSEIDKYEIAKKQYQEKTAELEHMFWIDLFEYYEWNQLPEKIRNDLQTLVYDSGHAYGYNETFCIADRYTNLVASIVECIKQS